MRVLTVRNPWAWAIIHAGKDVENRTRNIAGSYRGLVAIHVALQLAELPALPREIAAAVGRTARAGQKWRGVVDRIDHEDHPRNHLAPWYGLRGAVIGVVDLTDVHSASVIDGCGRLDHDCPEHGTCRHHCSPWAEGPSPDGWYQHLVLTNPIPLAQPIPAKGRLGLWRPDDQLHAAIEAQLASLAGREEQ